MPWKRKYSPGTTKQGLQNAMIICFTLAFFLIVYLATQEVVDNHLNKEEQRLRIKKMKKELQEDCHYYDWDAFDEEKFDVYPPGWD